MTPQLKALLDQLPENQKVDFDYLRAALKAVRFTGCTPIHWSNGELKQIDLGPPIRLSIVEGLDRPLDNGKGSTSK